MQYVINNSKLVAVIPELEIELIELFILDLINDIPPKRDTHMEYVQHQFIWIKPSPNKLLAKFLFLTGLLCVNSESRVNYMEEIWKTVQQYQNTWLLKILHHMNVCPIHARTS